MKVNRLLILILICALTCSPAVNVCANDEIKPAFELDYSDGTWKDISDNNITDITNANDTKVPVIESMEAANGTTKYLNFENASAIIVDGSTFADSDKLTVEVWAYVTPPGSGYSDMFGITSGNISSSLMGVEFFTWNGENRMWYNSTDTALDDKYYNKWTHFVYTRQWDEDAKTVTVEAYADGVRIDTKTKELTERQSGENAELYIGNSSKRGSPFNRKLSIFKVYTDVLNESTIAGKYEESKYNYINEAEPQPPAEPEIDPDNPLVFQMDLSSADGTVNDATGRTGNVSYVDNSNKPTYETVKTAGGETEYLLFDGAKPVRINGAEFAQSDELTVELWATVNYPGNGYPDLFGISHTNVSDAIMGAEFYVWDGVSTMWYNKTDTKSIGNGIYDRWAHYVFTRQWDEAAQQVIVAAYIDGKLTDRKQLEPPGLSNIAGMNFYIGGSGPSGNLFRGKIATANVYKKILSDEEILNNYNGSVASFTKAYFDITSEIQNTSDIITLAFNDDVDFSTVKFENIRLYEKASQRELKITLDAINTDEKTISLQIFEYLNENETYRAEVSEITDIITGDEIESYKEFCCDGPDITANVTFSDENGRQISSLKEVAACTSDIVLNNSSSAAKDCEILMVMYDEKGIAREISLDRVSVASKGITDVSLTCNVIGREGSRALVYILDCEDNVQSAVLLTPVEIKY